MEKQNSIKDDLLERKLKEFEDGLNGEGMDAEVDPKEAVDIMRKILDEATMGCTDGDPDDEIHAKFKKIKEDVSQKNFLKRVTENVQSAIDDVRKNVDKGNESFDGKGQLMMGAISVSTVLLTATRILYASYRFSSGNDTRYNQLKKLMDKGNEVLPGYYDWKSNLSNCFALLMDRRKLADTFMGLCCSSLEEGPLRRVEAEVIAHFKFVSGAYGDAAINLIGDESLCPVGKTRLVFGDDNRVYNNENGHFDFPLGLKGWVGEKGGRCVVAFAGTRLKEVSTIYADVEQIFGPSLMYICALGIVHELRLYSLGVTVVGHSLGGGLTQFCVAACSLEGIKGYGFNSAGLSTYTLEQLKEKIGGGIESVIHYRTAGDPVSRFGALIGKVRNIPDSEHLYHSCEDLKRAMGIILPG